MSNDEIKTWLRENSSGIYRPATEAADLIERLERENARLMSERQEWKTVVGGETFTTTDKATADEWEADGFFVERYFVPVGAFPADAQHVEGDAA